MSDPEYMVPLTLALGDAWPSDLVQVVTDGPVGEVLGKIGLVHLELSAPANVSATLLWRSEVALELPGIAGLKLVFGGDAEGHTRIDVAFNLADPFYVGIDDCPIQLRLPRDAFRPVVEEPDGTFTKDPDPTHVVAIGVRPSIGFSGDGTVVLTGVDDVEISTRFMIANSGIVLEVPRIALYLTEGDPPPEGLPEGWRGVFIERAVVHLPRAIDVEELPAALEFTNCGIGSGGFTGEVAADWSGDPVTAKLLGFTARLKRIELALQQNAFLRSEVEGEIELSFFDATVGVNLSLGADGEFAATLSAVSGGASETPDGLITFTLYQLLTLTVESMRFDNVDDVFRFTISGQLKPLLIGLDWPALDVEALSIDEHGNVDFAGGWLDFPQQQTLDFHGFQISLSEIGFGNEEDLSTPEPPEGVARPKRQWIGLSGGIRLVEGLPLSASVDGLKASWRPDIPGGDVKVTLEGVALSLEIPGTLRLSGEVRYEEVDDEHLQGDIFRGAVDLSLIALRTRVGGELIIGHLTETETGESFDVAFVVLNAEFPTAIPLGATGVGLYGLHGLAGINIAPDRHPSTEDPAEPESWYEWYKADRGGPRDVTRMQKWAPRRDHYALGAGLIFGTVYDDGYTINARALLAVLIPGPVILLEGRANLIKSRSQSNTDQGAFYLLAVIDGNGGTFQLNIDAQYELQDVIAIGGGAEAFFNFNDASAWHVWLGQKVPESKRIGADILSLFKVNAYLMLDANGFATGAKAALEIHESYGPLSVDIAVGLAFQAAIFWNPPQAEGQIELLGGLGIRIFGVALGIALRLLLEAKAAKPFRVHGLARFTVSLPFPLPNFDATVEFTWEDPTHPDPVWPLLEAVELTHHLRAESRWTPSRSEADAPVVPVDAVAIAKFARPLAGRSFRVQSGQLELLGHDPIDEWTFSYVCERASLFARRLDGTERLVAQGPLDVDVSSVVPFDFSDESLITGTDAEKPAWRLWTHERLPGASVYEREDRPARNPACPPAVEPAKNCIDFRSLAAGRPFGRRFRVGGWELRCAEIPTLRGGRLEATDLWVRFPRAMGRVEIRFAGSVTIRAFRHGSEVSLPSPARGRGDSLQDWAGEAAQGVDTVWIREVGAVALNGFSVQRICAILREDTDAANRMRRHRDASARDTPSAGRLMLKPRTRYRLELRTIVYQAHQSAEPVVRENAAESFYFETSDGPGANPLDASERTALARCHTMDPTSPAPHASFLGGHPLDAVAPYVAHTRPSADDDPFYYSMDPAIVFREAYFSAMYHPSWTLLIRIRDRNGHIVAERVGRRRRTTLPRMSLGEVTWQAAQARDGCAQAAPSHGYEGDTMLVAEGLSANLLPNRRYTLELVLQGCFERVLYQFSSSTSRYESPVAHLMSGMAGGQQFVKYRRTRSLLSGIPIGTVSSVRETWVELEQARAGLRRAMASGSLVAIHDAFESSRAARNECDRVCEDGFGVITATVRYTTHAPRPPRTELVAFTSPDGVLVMIESAEPIEWSRWVIRAVDPGIRRAVPRAAVACWNSDRTRAILVPREGPLGWERGMVDFEFSYLSAESADLPELTIAGAPYEPVPVLLRCNLAG
jgi:hypothetical protein